jgi:hypothetical protein
MADRADRRNPFTLQEDERHTLFEQRYATLVQAAERAGIEDLKDFIENGSYRCSVDILGRSKDECLCARITVRHPDLDEPHVRRIRLVSKTRLKLA